jgi:phytoene dehydrogenase-like protein
MEAVFMLHLGVDYDPMQFMQSALIYCYGMYDLSAATRKLRTNVYHGGDDGFLIFVPSYHAPDFAPEGKHCVTLYTVCPDTLAEGDWDDVKERYADRLIQLAERYLPDNQRQWFYPTVYRLMNENMERVNKDLEWFIAKFDYRNAGAPWGNSQDALPRTMQKLQGFYPNDPPYKDK